MKPPEHFQYSPLQPPFSDLVPERASQSWCHGIPCSTEAISDLSQGFGSLWDQWTSRSFNKDLDLGISKPVVCQSNAMVCMQVTFHDNDGNHENDEDNSNSYKQGVEC